MLRIVARDSARARTMPRRSPFTSVTPALSIATSVPVPIAMPTSACASAGRVVDAVAGHRDDAALAPAAARPRRPSGRAAPRRCTSSMPSLRATASAVVRLSPVSMTMRMPSACSAAIASGVVALIGSATPSRPASRPSTATNITVCAVARAAPRRARPASPTSTPSSSMQRAVAERDARGRRPCPSTPLPVSDSKAPAAAERDAALVARPRRSPPRADARCRARGSPRGAAARSRSTPAGGDDRHQPRLAFGQRAGLVDDERVDLAQHLDRLGVPEQHAQRRALARRDHDRHRRRQPERARAGDDQHRDRVDQRVAPAAARARRAPRRRTSATAIGDDRRHEPRRDRVGELLDRRAAALRLGHHARRSARAACRAPTRSARITSVPVPLTVAPMTRSPALLLDRDRLAGDHRLVDGARALERRRRRPGPSRPGRTRRRSPTRTCVERDVFLVAVGAHAPRASSAPGRAARGSPRRSRCARAARAPGRAAPA